MIKKSNISEAIAGNPNCEHVWVSEYILTDEAPHVRLLFSVAWKVSAQEIGMRNRNCSHDARTSALHLRNKVVPILSR